MHAVEVIPMSTAEIQSDQVGSHQGQTIRIKGHVHAVRDLGNLVFLVIRDSSSTVQAVVHQATILVIAKSLAPECVVIVEGSVVVQTKDKEQFEISVTSIEVLSRPATTLPVEISKNSKVDALALSTMLDYRPLTLRSEKPRAIFKIEAEFCAGFREFLSGERFTEIHSPKIVATGTEGGANLFVVEYFGKKAYLAQSPQFYKQIMVGAFERVFEIGPVYRAEQHDTTRHLNEYISMDFEMGFIASEQDLIRMQTRLLSHMFQRLKERCKSELELFQACVPSFETIPQLKLHEAISLLQNKLGWSGEAGDLDPEAERLLCQHFEKVEGCELVYVTHYPHSVRPFYAMPAPAEQGTETLSRSFDLLYRGLEVTTGGQRIHAYERLVESMHARSLEPTDFADYLQCFKYGMPPHGGLAIGLERLAKQLLGLPTVKLASLFPRDINRVSP
jgi:nondiscriminating aspartyl-tRNA synthetase